MMQPSYFDSFMPNLTQMYQSYQFGNQGMPLPLERSNQFNNRGTFPGNADGYYNQLVGLADESQPNASLQISPQRPDQNVAVANEQLQNSGSKTSPGHYDTANEMIPLKRPDELKEQYKELIEFDNDQFNSKSNSKFVKKGSKKQAYGNDDMPVGGHAATAESPRPTEDALQENLLEIEVIRKKPKKNKKKDLEK